MKKRQKSTDVGTLKQNVKDLDTSNQTYNKRILPDANNLIGFINNRVDTLVQNNIVTTNDNSLFLDWMWHLFHGYNILCYGIGNKKILFSDFVEGMLKGEDVIEIEIPGNVQNKPSPISVFHNLLRCINNLLRSRKGECHNGDVSRRKRPKLFHEIVKDDGSVGEDYSEHFGPLSQAYYILGKNLLLNVFIILILHVDQLRLVYGNFSAGATAITPTDCIFIIVNDIEDILMESSLELQAAFACLAQSRELCFVASVSNFTSPFLHLWSQEGGGRGWRWCCYHTPTAVPHKLASQVLSACENNANIAAKSEVVGTKGLSYVLRSLTPKLRDLIGVLVHLTKTQAEKADAAKAERSVANSNRSATNGETVGKQDIALSWNIVLQSCRSRLIVKDDTDLRKLMGELKDNRIAKMFSDSEGCLLVSLLINANDIESLEAK